MLLHLLQKTIGKALTAYPIFKTSLRTIAYKTAIVISTRFLSSIVLLFGTILYARRLSVENFGIYGLIISILTITTLIIDFGFNRIITRNIATVDNCEWNYLLIFTPIRILFSLFSVFIFVVLSYVLSDSLDVTFIAFWASLSLIPKSIALTLEGILVGRDKQTITAVGSLVNSVCITLLGLLALWLGFGLVGLFLSYFIGNSVWVGILFVSFIKYYPWQSKDSKPIRVLEYLPYIKEGLPYAFLMLLSFLYNRIDVTLLYRFHGQAVTGYYTSAYRLFDGFNLIALGMYTVLLPLVVRSRTTGRNKLVEVMKPIYVNLAYIGGLASIVTTVFAPDLIGKLYGPEYSSAGLILQILFLCNLFRFAHQGNSLIIFSGKMSREIVSLSLFTTFISVVSTVLLTLFFNAPGAAIATVIAEVVSFVAATRIVKREFPNIKPVLFVTIPFITIALSSLSGLLLRPFNLLLAILVSALLYATGFVVSQIESIKLMQKDDRSFNEA